MYYKPDWDQAKRRFQAFWANEVVDRCCVAVYAPRRTSKMPPFPELQWGPWLGGLEQYADDDYAGIRRWWTDPGQNYERMITWFENTYFGGEAIPATYVNWGAMPLAAFYGSPAVCNKNSVWYPEVITDWDAWKWTFDRATNEYWRQILAINQVLIDSCNGRYFIGSPEVGAAGDVLSLMRGMDKLCLDLVERPDTIKHAVAVLASAWVELHEQLYLMARDANDQAGVLAWLSLWAPGRHAQVACDFSSVISPRSFREFFASEIQQEGDWCEYCTYHLDGPQAIRTQLSTLLSFDQIDTIEFTPGSGSPPTLSPQYLPLYKRIQDSGRRLYLLVKADDIEPLMQELSPKGLFLCTQTASEDEADHLLRDVAKWSARGNVFQVP